MWFFFWGRVSLFWSNWFGTHYIALSDLQLLTSNLPQLLECWSSRHAVPYLAGSRSLLSSLKVLFTIIFIWCEYLCGYVTCVQTPEEGISFPGAGATGVCAPLDLGARHWTQALWESSNTHLISEPSLPPSGSGFLQHCTQNSKATFQLYKKRMPYFINIHYKT